MLVNRIIKLSTIASKDATRYHLNGVWLSCEKGKILVEVTDGHKASREYIENSQDLNFDGYFFFDHDLIKALKPIVKGWKYTELPIYFDSAQNNLVVGADIKLTVKRPDHKPPPFGQIYNLNSEHNGTHKVIGLNAKYLLEIAEALKEGKHEAVKLIIKDNQSPITVVVGNRDAVLMPCRV